MLTGLPDELLDHRSHVYDRLTLLKIDIPLRVLFDGVSLTKAALIFTLGRLVLVLGCDG